MKSIKYILAVLLLLLCAIAYLLFKEENDYIPFGLKLDNTLTAVLLDSGVSEANITEQFQKKHRDKKSKWVETVRELEIPSTLNTKKLKENIESRARQIGARVFLAQLRKESLRFELGRSNKVLQRLYFRILAPTEKIRIALVIDDIACDCAKVDGYIKLNIPVNFAVMPNYKFSLNLARKIKERGYKYLLHLPLEPEGYPKINPGKDAVLANMTDKEIKKRFNNALSAVRKKGEFSPMGVNNHMGSKFTANLAVMKTLLRQLKENNLFFLDSYTTPKSAGKKAAAITGLPYLRNDVFLDNIDSPEEIRVQLAKLLKIGKAKGYAVAIGHITKKNTFNIIRDTLKTFRDNGCEFVYLDKLISIK